MEKKEKWPTNQEIEIERMKEFIKLPLKKKLQYLEELNAFFHQNMPKKSKKAWEIIKEQGF